jgi:hypothetical protein
MLNRFERLMICDREIQNNKVSEWLITLSWLYQKRRYFESFLCNIKKCDNF